MRGRTTGLWSRDGGPSSDDAFHKSANPEIYVARPASERALVELRSHVESFAEHPALVAGAGLGKTLLLHVLAERLADRWVSVHLPYPLVPCVELCRWALQALDKPAGDDPEASLLAVADSLDVPGGLLLMMDDADAMPHTTARRIMALSRASEGRLRLVFAGTQRFHSGSGNWLADVREDVVQVDFDHPLSLDEGIQYLCEKLDGLDKVRRAVFPPDVLHAIWQESEGIPAAMDSAASDLMLRAVTRTSAGAPQVKPSERQRRARLVGLGGAAPRFRDPAERDPDRLRAPLSAPERATPVRAPVIRPPVAAAQRQRREGGIGFGGPGKFVLGSAAGMLIAVGLTGLIDPNFFHRLQPQTPGRPSSAEVAGLVHDPGLSLDAGSLGASRSQARPEALLRVLEQMEQESQPSTASGDDGLAGRSPSDPDDGLAGRSPSDPDDGLAGRSPGDPETGLPAVSAGPRESASANNAPPVPEALDEAAETSARAVGEDLPGPAHTQGLAPLAVAMVQVIAPEGTWVEIEGQTFGPAPFRHALGIPQGRREVTARLPDGGVVRRTVEATDGTRIVFY